MHTGVSNPTRARIHVIKWENQGFYLPMSCRQCEDAPCMTVCPKKAIYRDRDIERVMIDYDRCIGCKMCASACPFGAMGFDARSGRVFKCDLCDGDPQCVRFCDMKAVDYVETSKFQYPRMREAGENFSELMRKHTGHTE
jgi:Fe-S-cluster-containing hydrogenase component 2